MAEIGRSTYIGETCMNITSVTDELIKTTDDIKREIKSELKPKLDNIEKTQIKKFKEVEELIESKDLKRCEDFMNKQVNDGLLQYHTIKDMYDAKMQIFSRKFEVLELQLNQKIVTWRTIAGVEAVLGLLAILNYIF